MKKSHIQPEEANKVFTLSGISEQNAPYRSEKGTVDDWKDLLAKFTILGKEYNLEVFQLKKVASIKEGIGLTVRL